MTFSAGLGRREAQRVQGGALDAGGWLRFASCADLGFRVRAGDLNEGLSTAAAG